MLFSLLDNGGTYNNLIGEILMLKRNTESSPYKQILVCYPLRRDCVLFPWQKSIHLWRKER